MNKVGQWLESTLLVLCASSNSIEHELVKRVLKLQSIIL